MSSVATNELDVEWELYMSKSGTSNVREIFKEIRGYNSELDDLLNSAINCNVISTKLFVDILSFPELYEVIAAIYCQLLKSTNDIKKNKNSGGLNK